MYILNISGLFTDNYTTNYYPHNSFYFASYAVLLYFELAEIGERNELIFALTFYCQWKEILSSQK